MRTFTSREEAEHFRRVREARGRALAPAVREMGPNRYVVPSESGKGVYDIDWSKSSCDCPDFQRNNAGDDDLLPCKHIHAVGFFREMRERDEAVGRAILADREGAINTLERYLEYAPGEVKNALGILISS